MDEESTPSPEPAEDVNDMDYIPTQPGHAGAASGRTQLGSTSLATPLKSPPAGDYADKLVSGKELTGMRTSSVFVHDSIYCPPLRGVTV